MGRLVGAAAVALLVLISNEAAAQETRRLGIVFGAPTSVGAQFRVNDRLSIRGDAAVSSSTSETTSDATITFGPSPGAPAPIVLTTTSRQEFSTLPMMGSVLVTVARWEPVRLYTGGRLSAVRSSLSIERTTTRGNPPPGSVVFELPPLDDINTTTVDWTLSVGGFIGTQYIPHERFGIFGEAGLNFSLPDEGLNTFSSSVSSSRSRSWGTSGRVGVILFVK